MKFDVHTVLTVTTGRLLTRSPEPGDNGVGDVYRILGFMTNTSPFTHQLPRLGDECAPVLLKRFPELGSVNLAELDVKLKGIDSKDPAAVDTAIASWVSAECERCGIPAEFEIEPLKHPEPSKHPLEELVEMGMGPEKIIVVEVADQDTGS